MIQFMFSMAYFELLIPTIIRDSIVSSFLFQFMRLNTDHSKLFKTYILYSLP